jgi:hypothetical protein
MQKVSVTVCFHAANPRMTTSSCRISTYSNVQIAGATAVITCQPGYNYTLSWSMKAVVNGRTYHAGEAALNTAIGKGNAICG